MTGIIGAMDVEVATIRAAMTDTNETTISGIPFTKGKIGGRPAILARCGIGKVNAAICTQIMISVFHADEIINTGVAGAVAHGIRQNDIVIARRFVQHDVDTSPIGDPVGFVSTVGKIYFDADEGIAARLRAAIGDTASVVEGTVATGDQFVADKAITAQLRERFDAVACDMEGGAIAHVCTLAGIPFGAVRCISDSADENATMDYPTFAAQAAATCSRMVIAFMKA